MCNNAVLCWAPLSGKFTLWPVIANVPVVGSYSSALASESRTATSILPLVSSVAVGPKPRATDIFPVATSRRNRSPSGRQLCALNRAHDGRTLGHNLPLAEAGDRCAEIMDSTMRNLRCQYVQCDEIWTFVGRPLDGWGWFLADAAANLLRGALIFAK